MKFKLIKKFPDCNLEIGDTINFGESDEIEIYQKGVIYWYTLDEVKQYPEFFELVVEKDYEILEWTNPSGNVFTLNSDGLYYYETWKQCGVSGLSLDIFFSTMTCKISKVKRLSDGEVISIGDKLKLEHWNFWCKVIEIELEGNLVSFHLEQHKDCSSWYSQLELIKYVEPIYVTEDGYEVRNFSEARDFHWILDDGEETKYLYNNCPLSKAHLNAKGCLGSEARYKLFASEEKAKAYVAKKNEEKLLDSKVLSYNMILEVADLVGFKEFYYRNKFETQLKELVKSKQ